MICKPTLLLDKKKCLANINQMAEKAKRHNLVFRPHFKTHQSHEIGRWFKKVGVNKITVSSLGMAQYFAKDGWNDISIAFPVNALEVNSINDLASRIKLNLLVESARSIQLLKEKLTSPVGIFIKTDFGYNRTGVNGNNVELICELINELKQSNNLQFEGLLTHAGNSYDCRGKEAVLNLQIQYLQSIELLRAKLIDLPNLYISYGDTPTCSVSENFQGINEIRPGNFVFYDVTQTKIGSCTPGDIAVAMACPVVAKHPERNEVIIYGGGIHFSKDRFVQDGKTLWGRVVQAKESGWADELENVYLKKLSQEHGTIYGPQEYINSLDIGDIVYVLPIHSCMTADCMKSYFTTDGQEIKMYNWTK